MAVVLHGVITSSATRRALAAILEKNVVSVFSLEMPLNYCKYGVRAMEAGMSCPNARQQFYDLHTNDQHVREWTHSHCSIVGRCDPVMTAGSHFFLFERILYLRIASSSHHCSLSPRLLWNVIILITIMMIMSVYAACHCMIIPGAMQLKMLK